MAQELAFQDEAFATKFLEKALAAGVRFTPDQVLEMVGAVEEVVLGKIAKRTDVPFDREQPEKIYMMIDDTSFQKISQRAKIDVFDDEPLAYGQCEQVPNIPTKKKKVGLFTALVAFVAGSALTGQVRKKHHGHCDGDCANCPPYYGYRMGKAINTAANLAETRETKTCKEYRIYIAYTENTGLAGWPVPPLILADNPLLLDIG